MPNIFKNQKPNRFVLKSDMQETPQPCFYGRRLTFGELRKFMELMEGFTGEGDAGEIFANLEDTLEDVIVGWDNMGSYVKGQDKIGSFLDPSEVMELTMLVLNASQVSGEEGNG